MPYNDWLAQMMACTALGKPPVARFANRTAATALRAHGVRPRVVWAVVYHGTGDGLVVKLG
jgi:hypothetical protein